MRPVTLVINTRNEELHLDRCLNSVKNWVSQIVLVDMESCDSTLEIAKRYNAEIYSHPNVGYVEPARNEALSYAKQPWILLLDADECIGESVKKYLDGVIDSNGADFVKLPRLNYIFGSTPKHGGWWPDYNVRFFRNGRVSWQNQIHSQPITSGEGLTAPADVTLAIVHNHYQNISQFISRLDRYTTIQAKDLKNQHNFHWHNLVNKPTAEFYRRYFDLEGWKDGVLGLALSLLQSFSELVLYLKIWEIESYEKADIQIADFDFVIGKESKNYHSWMAGLFGKQKLQIKRFKHAIQKRI